MKLLKIILAIYIIIIISLIIYHCKYNITNEKRHLNDDFGYAHYSKIHRYNYLLYPSLLFTSPKRFILEENQALWIPKGWWHWIESFDTIAINFWLTDIKKNNKYEIPFITKETLSKKIVDEINNFNNNVSIWKSSEDNIETKDINKKDLQKNEIIFTLPGYVKNFTKDKLNQNLIDKIKPYVKIPQLLKNIKTSEIDYNLWISDKFHDTGLHYDDNYGLLCVLKGKKYITLYPPSDTQYLKPLPILPYWVNNDPVEFEYNTYSFIKKLNKNMSLSSSRLLYETLKCYNNKDIMLLLSNKLNFLQPNQVVWGFKLHNNVVRWEIYIYHYSLKNNEEPSYLYKFDLYDSKKDILIKMNEKYNKKLIIHSFDLYENGKIGKDIHFYYNSGTNMSLPFFGTGETLTEDGDIVFESYYVLDISKRFIEQYDNYMKKINFTNTKVFNLKILLEKYNCTYYCIHNKNPYHIFIQYLGISINDFILFLEEFNYPIALITHVKTNSDKHKLILHEITIVYDINTSKPIRSAFYGLV